MLDYPVKSVGSFKKYPKTVKMLDTTSKIGRENPKIALFGVFYVNYQLFCVPSRFSYAHIEVFVTFLLVNFFCFLVKINKFYKKDENFFSFLHKNAHTTSNFDNSHDYDN